MIMLTKEDYMKLPKERLAELLAERDCKDKELHPFMLFPSPRCYEPNGVCSNPFRDCINCPKKDFGSGTTTFTTTNTAQPKIILKEPELNPPF